MRWRVAYVKVKSALTKLRRKWIRDRLGRKFLRRTKRMVWKVPIVAIHWVKWRIKRHERETRYKRERRRMYGPR
jgi:hypothetical protein